MKVKLMKMCGVLLILFLVSTLTGCDTPSDSSDDDGGVHVALSTMKLSGTGATEFYSDEPFYCRAAAWGEAGTVSYSWYLDGTFQPKATSSEITAYIRSSATKDHTVKVTVTDGDTTDSESVSVHIIAAASLFIRNKSSSSITTLSYKPSGSTWQDWDAGYIYPNYTLLIWKIPAGYYDIKAGSSAFDYYEKDNYLFSNGVESVWDIYDGDDNFTLSPNVYGKTISKQEKSGLPESTSAGELYSAGTESIIAVPFSALKK